MARNLPKKLMASAQRVKVFNSGLAVWLYDRSFRNQLKESGVFETDADPNAFEKAMIGFAKKGRLICYSLMQDDSIDVAIAVGDPFPESGVGGIPWRPQQRAFLSLPTGRLVVESNDSLTIRSLDPTDPGAEIDVPPGNYLVTLNRVDWDLLAENEIDWEGPSEFITLTSGPLAKPVPGQPAVLEWELPEPDDAGWQIADGVYSGSVIFDDDLMAMRITIDSEGVARLGLTDRSVTVLSIPELNLEFVVVWISGDRSRGEYYDRLERLRPPIECRGKEWAICNLEFETRGDSSLFCLRRDATIKIPKKHRNVWLNATMTVFGKQALEKG